MANECVCAALTHDGGRLAPLTFSQPNGVSAEPYYVAPWAPTTLRYCPTSPSAKFIRGDFFNLLGGRCG
jgi:hypothetical protein